MTAFADRAAWLRDWSVATAIGAVGATALDAVILQLRRSYFTGGFLAQDSATTPAAIAAFFAGSLLADAAVVGALTALSLWVLRRFAVSRTASIAAASALGLAPVIIANEVEYRLASYLGDAFDLQLLFDLAGREPRELIAVSSAQLVTYAAVAGALVITFAVVAWVLWRRSSGRRQVLPHARVNLRVAFAPALVLIVVGTVATAVVRSSSDILDNGLRRKPTGRLLGAVVNELSDVDRDGSGLLGRPGDPDLFDARIRPYALEIPGNGVDEDGVGGDLPAEVAPDPEVASGVRTGWRSKPDVILFVLESVRADAIGARLAGKPATPVLNSLAARGISAARAYSHNGYTVQSRYHIFSGRVADVRRNATLIDDFNANGYETAYFSAQDESFGGGAQRIGFNRADVAYDARADRARRFSTFTTAGSLAVPYDVVQERVTSFLSSRSGDRPLFLHVNFQDTHYPYHHRGIRPLIHDGVVRQADIAPQSGAALRAMYLNTAANVDRAIGELLEHATRTLGREPAVIVLSDHGESLFDEGFLGHGYALNDAQTRIPFIAVNLPLTIEQPFGQAELRDAIADALRKEPDGPTTPVLRDDPSKRVFQYLGVLRGPAQIGFVRLNGRTLYDFRNQLFRRGDGPWQRPSDLSPADHAAFLELVHAWELIRLSADAAEPRDQS